MFLWSACWLVSWSPEKYYEPPCLTHVVCSLMLQISFIRDSSHHRKRVHRMGACCPASGQHQRWNFGGDIRRSVRGSGYADGGFTLVLATQFLLLRLRIPKQIRLLPAGKLLHPSSLVLDNLTSDGKILVSIFIGLSWKDPVNSSISFVRICCFCATLDTRYEGCHSVQNFSGPSLIKGISRIAADIIRDEKSSTF